MRGESFVAISRYCILIVFWLWRKLSLLSIIQKHKEIFFEIIINNIQKHKEIFFVIIPFDFFFLSEKWRNCFRHSIFWWSIFSVFNFGFTAIWNETQNYIKLKISNINLNLLCFGRDLKETSNYFGELLTYLFVFF